MYKNVKKLLPGHLLRINTLNGSFEEVIYFNKKNNEIKETLTEDQWIDRLDEALNTAVERQMLSDVPLGFFLSGGVDSSLLVAIAKKHNPDIIFDCFTINYECF